MMPEDSAAPQPSDPERRTFTAVFEVRNRLGIHGRPAARISKLVDSYNVSVKLEKIPGIVIGGKEYPDLLGNSFDECIIYNSPKYHKECLDGLIMPLIDLALCYGSRLRCTAEGPDAEALLVELGELFERQFEEE